jgi:tRNA dimethylallyltransferase
MLPLIILTGPTGSGKSETALALARKLDTEIISADSLQVYKYFDIGTAKPSLAVREEIPHHLIDILEPHEEFNAFDFKTRALEVIRELMSRDKIPILVGGTALYIKVLIEDYDCAEGASPEIRDKIRQDISDQGVEKVYQELQRVDPEYATKISETDSLRIERALGVYLDTGKRFSEFHEGDSPSSGRFPIHTFILNRDRAELYSRIDQRVDKMIEDGLPHEAKNILDRGYNPELKPFKSIGYAQMIQYHQGNVDLERATYEIKRETRHYAKRQLTWFRKMQDAVNLPVESNDTAQTLADKLLTLLPKVTACFLACFLALFLGFAQTGEAAKVDQHYAEAKKLFQKKEWGKAKNSLLALQNHSPDSIEAKRSRFLLALIHKEQGKPEEAIKLLDPLSKNYAEVEDYIRFYLIQAQSQSGKHEKVQANILELLQRNPNTLLYAKLQLVLAEAQIQLGEKTAGMKTLEETILSITQDFSHQKFRKFLPDLIFKLGELQEQTGKQTEAYLSFRQLHIKYPNHDQMPEAETAIKRLSALETVKEVPLTMREHTDRIRGLLQNVRYKEVVQEIQILQKENDLLPGRFYFFLARAHGGLRDRKSANKILQKFLKTYPHHAKVQNAKFDIGRNLWNLGRPTAGAKYFKTVTQDSPSSELAVKAQFFLGKIYEEQKNFPEALKNYKAALDKYPNESYAQWAGWRLGWVHYLDGKFEDAFNKFQDAANRFPDKSFIEYNLYWSAKSAEKLNKKDVARDLYVKVAELYPYTFHGIRAKDRLQALGVKALPVNHTSAKEEKQKLGRPLSTREKFHHIRASELAQLGLNQDARNEIIELQKTVRKNLTGVLWLSQLYHQAQGYPESLRLLHLYKDFTTKTKEKNLSAKFWKHFFPLAYEDAVLGYAKTRKVDPYFVNGIIRQESLFDSQALSPAGARGLMQIMPATGKKLYPKTKLKKPFETDALFDPDLNIRLGVKYVSQLNKRFNSNGMHILISYNAGPHVLKKWLKRFGHFSDQDVFIESIPYPETRRYVKHVLRNLGIYKTLYSLS